MVDFNIKQDIVKPVIDKRNLNKMLQIEDEDEDKELDNLEENIEGKKVLEELTINFDLAVSFTKQTKVPRGDDNWFKHCGLVMRKLGKEYPDSLNNLVDYLTAHLIETLLFKEKVDLMNYLFSLDRIREKGFEWYAKKYFDNNIITTKKGQVFFMYNLNKFIVMVLNNKNKWEPAEPEEQREIAMTKEVKEYLKFNKSDYNKYVGFIGYEKHNKYLVFKTKNMESDRDTGARCDEAGKDKTIKLINSIMDETKFTNENTRMVKDADGNVTKEAISHTELCVYQEFILRLFNDMRKNGKDDKKWFLTPEMAIFNKLYKVIA